MRNILEVEWAGLDEVYTVADLGLHGQEGENEKPEASGQSHHRQPHQQQLRIPTISTPPTGLWLVSAKPSLSQVA